MRLAATIALTTLAAPATAQQWSSLGPSLAFLAASGWRQTGAAGLSSPDDRHAVISFWEAPEGQNGVYRCTTVFDQNFNQVSDTCVGVSSSF